MPSLPPGFFSCLEPFNVRYINGSIETIPASVGPNGGPVGYNSGGAKVEIVPGEDFGCDDEFCENILRRSDQDILAIFNVLWDRVRVEFVRGDGPAPIPARRTHSCPSDVECHECGATSVTDSPFGLGLLWGRMSALAWTMGTDWSSSMEL